MSDLGARMRALLVVGALGLAAGGGVTAYGVVTNDPARSLAGASLIITGLTLLVLVCIRRWVTDTHAERARLADAIRTADVDRTRAVAAHAAVEAERVRVARDARVERGRNARTLAAERDAMQTEFDAQRAQIAAVALEQAVALLKGKIGEQAPARERSRVLPFPQQAERARARDAHQG